MSTSYKATCRCGATVDVPYSDNFKDWLSGHKECLKQPLNTQSTDLDRICQDLQEKTYTQAMRIAELEAKLKEKS